LFALSIATVAMLVSACGAQPESEESTENSAPQSRQQDTSNEMPDVNAAVVRGARQIDYPGTASVVEAADKVRTSLQGEVVGWSDGRSTVESDGSGYEAIAYSAVLKVRVREAYSPDAVAKSKYVYVEVPRGNAVKVDGEAPKGTEPVITTVEELSKAVPEGTPIILLADPAGPPEQVERATPGLSVRNDGKGLPDRATLVTPSVQGLIFRDETGAFASGMAEDEGSWGWVPPNVPDRKSFDYLAQELEKDAS
jgi:hypothetical protein